MIFKANFNYTSYQIENINLQHDNNGFYFTKSQVFYTDKNRNWFFKNIKVLDGDYYELTINDNIDRLNRYEIIINKQRPIHLTLDKKNEIRLKWIHKLYYVQKDSSNCLKTAIISSTIGVLMYFLGQFIGFKSGYQDGLIKAQQETQKSDQQQPKK